MLIWDMEIMWIWWILPPKKTYSYITSNNGMIVWIFDGKVAKQFDPTWYDTWVCLKRLVTPSYGNVHVHVLVYKQVQQWFEVYGIQYIYNVYIYIDLYTYSWLYIFNYSSILYIHTMVAYIHSWWDLETNKHNPWTPPGLGLIQNVGCFEWRTNCLGRVSPMLWNTHM